jgi:hypothetical protein
MKTPMVQEDTKLVLLKQLQTINTAISNSKEHTKFRVLINKDTYKDILTYGEIMDHINKDDEQGDILWKFNKGISGHQGPLGPTDEGYNRSTYNVQVEWENREITFEPLLIIAANDPVSCAIYAKQKDLLDTPGWKQIKKLARCEKVLQRAANHGKLRSFNTAPHYKYGFEIPRNYAHTLYRLMQGTRIPNGKMPQDLSLNSWTSTKPLKTLAISKQMGLPKDIQRSQLTLSKHDGRHKV